MLPRIAEELGADERTLRRAARRGAVRCRRPAPRQLELAAGELDYLRSHWRLLQRLTLALRNERNVRLAVLYGSVARGDDRATSDIDLLVRLRTRTPGAARALAERLEQVLGRRVDAVEVELVEQGTPLLLRYAIDEGRVLVDREAEWPGWLASRDAVAAAARRVARAEHRAVEESWRMLAEDAR